MESYVDKKAEVLETYNSIKGEIEKVNYAKIYADFSKQYGKDALMALNGKDLLYRMFAPKSLSSEGLTYNLEYCTKDFGGCGGGSVYKFFLYYSNDEQSWMLGTAHKNVKPINENDAIAFAQNIRDDFVKIFDYIDNQNGFKTVNDYQNLDKKILQINKDLYSRNWVGKYLHMLYPQYFSCFYNADWKKVVLNLMCKFDTPAGMYSENGAISLISDEIGINNYSFFKCMLSLLPNDEESLLETDSEEGAEEELNDMDEGVVKELPVRSPRTNMIHPLNAILYGAPGTGKTYSTAEYAVAIVENRAIKDENREELMKKYRALQKEGKIIFTTFHQSYGYEDFIQGLRPENNNGVMEFKPVDGVFKKIADKALYDNNSNYVIIIDEINRANMSKVLGELITLIEEDKRWGEINELSVTLPSGAEFAVPNNLYIVGTMNTADKSISIIDVALRRRFEFIELQVELDKVSDPTLRKVLKKINEKLIAEKDSTDLLVGHAYFMNKTINDLDKLLNRSIIPLLYEYFFDNGKKVKSVIEEAIKDTGYIVDDGVLGRIKVIKE